MGTTNWVALLDEDEDDYLFWQMGFGSWANQLELAWFRSAESFLLHLKQAKLMPALILLNGVLFNEEEAQLLGDLKQHKTFGQIPILILAGALEEGERSEYLALGASDYLIKPATLQEMKLLMTAVNQYAHKASKG